MARHFKRERTRDLALREYHWPRMTKDVSRYVKACQTCYRAKTKRHKPYGLLNPLPIATRPWGRIEVDFIIGLPIIKGSKFDAILVIIDHFTKQAHFVPCQFKHIDARATAKLIQRELIRLHGYLDIIVFDRGTQFINEFTAALNKKLGVKAAPLTASRPQTNE